jgi:hypothetical protein
MIQSYRNPFIIAGAVVACGAVVRIYAVNYVPLTSIDGLLNAVILAGAVIWCAWIALMYKELEGYYITQKFLWIGLKKMDVRTISSIHERDINTTSRNSLYRWVIEGVDKGKNLELRFWSRDTNIEEIFRRIIDLRPGEVEVDSAVYSKLHPDKR